MKSIYLYLLLALVISCKQATENQEVATQKLTQLSLIVLGTVQDAGSPHIACKKECCRALFNEPDKNRKVVSLGIIDPESKQSYIFEATPDLGEQLKTLQKHAFFTDKETPDGVFLTHAHIGHYAGLMYFGKEAMNAQEVPVYAMPKMDTFLTENGPWSQLVRNKNIVLNPINEHVAIQLNPQLSVIPFTVPHRDEYSETVGFTIVGPNKRVLFIPDIDKWEKWETSIVQEISKVDYAFLDATFYDGAEINNRDIAEIPHPFIIESMEKFKNLAPEEKNKIYFIHFNHTNPVLNLTSKQAKKVIDNGFNIAQIHDLIAL